MSKSPPTTPPAMKATLLLENLKRGVEAAARVTAARSTLPVLGCVLLDATTTTGFLRVVGTNLEVSTAFPIGAKVDSPGAIAVPAKTLLDFVKTLTGEHVALEVTERTQTITITCGRSRGTIKGLSPQEFPIVPTGDQLVPALSVPASTIYTAIGQVIFACATDDSRAALMGALVESDTAGQLVFSAADGFRLVQKTIALTTQPDHNRALKAVIPARALAEVKRLIKKDDEDTLVEVCPVGDDRIGLRVDKVEIVCNTFDHKNFPDISSFVKPAASPTTRVVVQVDAFRQACKTAEIFARESAHTVRLKIRPSKSAIMPGAITISGVGPESGEGVNEVDATVEGEGIDIGFNTTYLIDVADAVESPYIVLELAAPTSPARMLPAGQSDLVCVVMPMHIGGK